MPGARRIARLAITNWAATAPKKWRPDPSLLYNTIPSLLRRPPPPRPSPPVFQSDIKRSSSRFGSAGNRTPKQEKTCIDYANHLINSIPSSAIIAFTDGSASPNPGPCGAGATLYAADGSGWEVEAHASLGHGTNNIGELWAIGMAVQLSVEALPTLPLITHLYILSDSQLSNDLLSGKSKASSPALRSLVEAVMFIITTIPPRVSLEIRWVPAHVGIERNERADKLAARGSRNSKRGQVSVDRHRGIEHVDFLPPD
jgi:ribonuclease HI